MTENKQSFFARIEPRLSPSEFVRVRGAYFLAKFGHRGQVRNETNEAGNPLRYFEHVRRVAIILMDEAQCYDADLVCSALLHDTLEDTEDVDAALIEQFMGPNVARNVRLLSKVPKEGYVERLETASVGVLLVKGCDRVDNLRSLDECEHAFKVRQYLETRDKYLPMFHKALEWSHDIRLARVVSQIEGLIPRLPWVEKEKKRHE